MSQPRQESISPGIGKTGCRVVQGVQRVIDITRPKPKLIVNAIANRSKSEKVAGTMCVNGFLLFPFLHSRENKFVVQTQSRVHERH
jgi:hypothetical protein